MKILAVSGRPKGLMLELLELWEASVRATHHFLADDDIRALKPYVEQALPEIPSLLCSFGPDGLARGFIGLDGEKIEMLFIRPQNRGQGLGRQLIDSACSGLKAAYVDVNEQNRQGLAFYRHLGFKVIGRSALDGQGRPFPILHMQRRAATSGGGACDDTAEDAPRHAAR